MKQFEKAIRNMRKIDDEFDFQKLSLFPVINFP